MIPEDQQDLNKYVQAMAKILYKDADPTPMTNLAELEALVRAQVQEPVTPRRGFF